jgi:hypothetical protein
VAASKYEPLCCQAEALDHSISQRIVAELKPLLDQVRATTDEKNQLAIHDAIVRLGDSAMRELQGSNALDRRLVN